MATKPGKMSDIMLEMAQVLLQEPSKFLFRTFGGGWQAAQRVEWLPQIDREATLGAEIDGWIAAYPVRLRSSVSWVIEAFRRVCFGDGCGIFSS